MFRALCTTALRARGVRADMGPPQQTATSPRVSPDEENVRRGLGPAMPGFSSNGTSALDSAHVDHAAPALASVDRLMSTICSLGNVSMNQLQAQSDGKQPSTFRNRHFDAAESAITNISGLADVISKLSKR